MSIMDSFLKKQQNSAPKPKVQNTEINTAEKIEAQPSSPVRGGKHEKLDEGNNDFKELISKGDFSF